MFEFQQSVNLLRLFNSRLLIGGAYAYLDALPGAGLVSKEWVKKSNLLWLKKLQTLSLMLVSLATINGWI